MFEDNDWFEDDDSFEEDDIQDTEARDALLENDELSIREAAFVDGYEDDEVSTMEVPDS